jgi:hypothetical protein
MNLNRKPLLFISVQLTILFAVTFAVCDGLGQVGRRNLLPRFTEQPINVAPLYNDA